MGYGNHLPPHVNIHAPIQKGRSSEKITLRFHIRRGNNEDARLAEEIESLSHVDLRVTLVSESLWKSLGTPYIVKENGDKLRGNNLLEYLKEIKR